MALLGVFIGINKYRDPLVRDLSGAVRDATVLWALFTDTIPELEGERLLDSAATAEQVRYALRSALSQATENDVVVISFSGHGTTDHALVLHDSEPKTAPASTLPLADLVSWFRSSKAKIVLCLLDCCFSGEAPARVFEETPMPRSDATPLQDLAGRGRILLAAAAADERAYELPSGRHGILTKAFVDVFEAATGAVDLFAAASEIMERVRAEASRMGRTQTPVLFGHTEGGFTLPALRRGSNFAAAFPELAGLRVGSSFSELQAFGFPEAVLATWEKRFSDGLNALQVSAINELGILADASGLVIAPTSSGKTFIGELAAIRSITAGKKAVFLLPFKALVNEKYDHFRVLYGDALGARVIRCSGDHGDQVGAFVRGKYDIALLTYEMALAIMSGNPACLNQIGVVVLDEAQFLADRSRGISVELLLTLLLAKRDIGIRPQLLVLGAVIGDANSLEGWLGCRKLFSTDRPVPLTEGVLDRSGDFLARMPSGEEKRVAILPRGAIRSSGEEPRAKDLLVPLLRELVKRDERVIVFRNSRGATQGCARYLAAELGLPAATNALANLPTTDLSSTSQLLRECLRGSVAFHNTNLTPTEKEVVERYFRQKDGEICVLVATTTLAAGINTPASTVVLVETTFPGPAKEPLSVAEFKNMAGRAGRLGFREEGKAILLPDNELGAPYLFSHYVLGTPEPMRSSFDPQDVSTWLVRLLAQIDSVPRGEMVHLLGKTYGGYLATRANPDWLSRMTARVTELVVQMERLGLLEEDNGKLRLTLLGRACGESPLAFASAMRLVELVRQSRPEDLTPESLVCLVQALPEMDVQYTPMQRKGQSESIWPGRAVADYGLAAAGLLQRNAGSEVEYYARAKRAVLLRAWMNGEPIGGLERVYSTHERFPVGHGDIRAIADKTRWLLRSTYRILVLLVPQAAEAAGRMDEVFLQLEFGLPASALGLLTLPERLSRGEHLALIAAGATSPEGILQLPEKRLIEILGAPTAARLLGSLHRSQAR